MQVKLGDNAIYPMMELSSISFLMPSGDILALNDVFFVPVLTKNLLSVSCMTNLQYSCI
jgi:hypothetical protein